MPATGVGSLLLFNVGSDAFNGWSPLPSYGVNVSSVVYNYFGLGGTWLFHGFGWPVVFGDNANTNFLAQRVA